jgi:hypothetical protein
MRTLNHFLFLFLFYSPPCDNFALVRLQEKRKNGHLQGVQRLPVGYTLIHLSSYKYFCPNTLAYVSSYSYIRVLILLYTCPRTPTCVSSYSYIRVLILLYMCPHITLLSSSEAPLVAFSYVCCVGITASMLYYFTDTECMYPPQKTPHAQDIMLNKTKKNR